jgi:hypothetical protein
MSNFDLNSYETVDSRLKRFLESNPDARVFTNIEKLEGDLVVIKAWIYKNADEQAKGLFLATGYAYEREGKGFVNTTSHIENCETSAIGRALANLGMNGALRPSREEMQKAERMTPMTPKTTEQTTDRTEVCQFGKDNGKKWADMELKKIDWYINLFKEKVATGGQFEAQNKKVLEHLTKTREELENGK